MPETIKIISIILLLTNNPNILIMIGTILSKIKQSEKTVPLISVTNVSSIKTPKQAKFPANPIMEKNKVIPENPFGRNSYKIKNTVPINISNTEIAFQPYISINLPPVNSAINSPKNDKIALIKKFPFI